MFDLPHPFQCMTPHILDLCHCLVEPCKNFMHLISLQLAEQVLAAVEDNTLSVEPVVQPTLPVVKASAVERGGPR